MRARNTERPQDRAGVCNEAEVGLPPLQRSRRETWELYRLAFLPDGYPGRRVGDAISPHPLYGNYVISDYLAQYRQSGDREYLDAARRVANAALARMQKRGDALLFTYEPGTGISSLPHRFYSGLTQARYLGTLGRLLQMTGDDLYREAARAVMQSLLIPTAEGGVCRPTPGGAVVIEEYAHALPDYTLNGWTTATLLIADYGRAAGDETARDLFHRSARGIAEMLPLYDVPELANSRYRLSGPVPLRVSMSAPDCSVSDARILIPGQGTYPVRLDGGVLWENRIVRGVEADGSVSGPVELDVTLCRVTWPEPNRIAFRIHAPHRARMTASIGVGRYEPLESRIKTDEFTEIASVELVPGQNEIDIPIPWASAELVAYPTNFKKRLGGRQYNQYHFIHIDTLTKLGAYTGSEVFCRYATRWQEYVERWPNIPVYAGADIELRRYAAPAADETKPAPWPSRRWLRRLSRSS
jgi:hypothetical protein